MISMCKFIRNFAKTALLTGLSPPLHNDNKMLTFDRLSAANTTAVLFNAVLIFANCHFFTIVWFTIEKICVSNLAQLILENVET